MQGTILLNFLLFNQEDLSEDHEVVWIVEFFTTWSPPCHAAMPAFASLSNQYASEYLRFGKIDVGKYPEAAKKCVTT